MHHLHSDGVMPKKMVYPIHMVNVMQASGYLAHPPKQKLIHLYITISHCYIHCKHFDECCYGNRSASHPPSSPQLILKCPVMTPKDLQSIRVMWNRGMMWSCEMRLYGCYLVMRPVLLCCCGFVCSWPFRGKRGQLVPVL